MFTTIAAAIMRICNPTTRHPRAATPPGSANLFPGGIIITQIRTTTTTVSHSQSNQSSDQQQQAQANPTPSQRQWRVREGVGEWRASEKVEDLAMDRQEGLFGGVEENSVGAGIYASYWAREYNHKQKLESLEWRENCFVTRCYSTGVSMVSTHEC
jgi:hypothetical protein